VVKRVFITLDDSEYQRLIKAKGNLTWKDFVFQLLDFKQKMEQEDKFVPRNSLKEPYVMQAQALRKLGSLLNVVWKDGKEETVKEGWELEVSALLPLHVSGAKLSEEEKRELLHLLANTMEQLVSELYSELSEETKWLAQAFRMLAKGYVDLYDLSMDNFVDERSRRQGTSTD